MYLILRQMGENVCYESLYDFFGRITFHLFSLSINRVTNIIVFVKEN